MQFIVLIAYIYNQIAYPILVVIHFTSFLFFLISFLKKSSQIPRITYLPDCSTPQHLQSFTPPNTKLQTLTLRTDPPAAQRDRPPRRLPTATTGLPPSLPPAAPSPKLDQYKFQICTCSIL